ncbi:MFS transporter [Streptomyces sp. PU-14G]|uniref:MFS transporter n=1 Tax=Streptomyces sp. PU-14G TaxID=2800808 RepID=UPI0034DF8B64
MSTTDKARAASDDNGQNEEEVRAFAWLRSLGPRGRRAFAGAFGGYGLDAYDFYALPLSMVAIAAYFHLSSGQTGLLVTVTMVASGAGGALAGVLADRVGRVRALLATVVTYALFTVACGAAPNYETLLVFRALQGVGFGGEWAVGAVLVAEYTSARHRGRTLAAVQSAWAVGWGLAVLVYTAVFGLLEPSTAWRVMFFTGALPALLVLYVRKNVSDAPAAERQRARHSSAATFAAVFRHGLLRTTVFASLMATGVQGGYYTLATWVPAYLAKDRGFAVVTTGGFLAAQILGAFLGYLAGGYLTDLLGRKKTIAVFAAASAACVLGYTRVPEGADALLLVLGFPLGFCMSAIFSGFGSFLAELYPTSVRGTGQGFTYNVGRGLGAAFPALVGALADSWGVGGALVFGAAAYAIAALALLGLPETRGRELADLD